MTTAERTTAVIEGCRALSETNGEGPRSYRTRLHTVLCLALGDSDPFTGLIDRMTIAKEYDRSWEEDNIRPLVG